MSDTKTFTTVVIYLSYYLQPFLDMLVWLRIYGWELIENTHIFRRFAISQQVMIYDNKRFWEVSEDSSSKVNFI